MGINISSSIHVASTSPIDSTMNRAGARAPIKVLPDKGPIAPPTREASAPIKTTAIESPVDDQPISLPATLNASGRLDNAAKTGARLNISA